MKIIDIKGAKNEIKEIIQLAILAVIGFALGMIISMLTASNGMLSMYVSAGLAAFVIAPLFTIAVKRIKKRGTAFLFWLIYSLLYSFMGKEIRSSTETIWWKKSKDYV